MFISPQFFLKQPTVSGTPGQSIAKDVESRGSPFSNEEHTVSNNVPAHSVKHSDEINIGGNDVKCNAKFDVRIWTEAAGGSLA